MPVHDTSIKRKVMMAIMLTVVTVLLVMVAAFMVYDLVTFRQTMVRNLGTQGRIMAENVNVAMAFKNEGDAENVLHSLYADPHIQAAVLYDAAGKIFVKYPPSIPDPELPPAPGGDGAQFGKHQLTLFQPVEQSGRRLGTLYLRSDLAAIYTRLELYGGISVVILVGSLLVAFWLSNTMQKRIANPIIALAETARKISGQHDYSVRAKKLSNDELGDLTEAFNAMLDQIQANITARKQQEEELQGLMKQRDEQARLFDATLSSITDLAYTFDLEGNWLYANKPLLQIWGKSLREITGKSCLELGYPPELAERLKRQVKEVVQTRRPVRGETYYTDAAGREDYHEYIFSPVFNAEGDVTAVCGTTRLATERKRAEMELKEARDQALAASRAKDDFLAALSHELRTPLNPVLLLTSDAVMDPKLSAETRASFEMIRRNVELEARLIDDLLDLTRITHGKLSLDLQLLDIHDVLLEAVGTVQNDAEKKQVRLVLDLHADRRVLFGDSVRLQQVFWNVLKNAVKFTPSGGKITVTTFAAEGWLNVKIVDTGIGLKPEEIRRVFDAFAQGDHAGNSAHRFGGLGLGLAISRMLIELHAGSISAESAGSGQGATFLIKLSLAAHEKRDALPSPADGPAQISMPALTTANAGDPLRILLVEDHEPTRKVLTQLLERRHYQVTAAGSVAEARSGAEKSGGHFHLVISDIGLPDGSGYDLMAELRERYHLKGIALTGYGAEQDVVRSEQSGFVAHLTKPVRMESLDNALAAILNRNPSRKRPASS